MFFKAIFCPFYLIIVSRRNKKERLLKFNVFVWMTSQGSSHEQQQQQRSFSSLKKKIKTEKLLANTWEEVYLEAVCLRPL